MARQLDRIVVVDVESTCWEGAPRPGQVSEIIEVGACLLDPATGDRSDRDHVLIKPASSKVSAFCTRLTTLTQEQVDAGVAFMDACNWLEKRYMAHRRPWASWGDYDRKMFEGQCRRVGVRYPFGPTHFNAKTLHALLTGGTREVGLGKALEGYGWEFEGTHHRGVDDAWNVARILGHLLASRRP